MGTAIVILFMGLAFLFAVLQILILMDQQRRLRRMREWMAMTRSDTEPVSPADMITQQRTAGEQERLLLLRVLTPEQAQSYGAQGSFHITASSGRRYLITDGGSNNVSELDKHGHTVARFCITTTPYTSRAGQVAAQALLLSTNEEAFRKIANKSRVS